MGERKNIKTLNAKGLTWKKEDIALWVAFLPDATHPQTRVARSAAPPLPSTRAPHTRPAAPATPHPTPGSR